MDELTIWAGQVRQAWRQAKEKSRNHGRCTKHCPWTYRDFRAFFQSKLEEGVKLGVLELHTGDWQELLRSCKRGACLGSRLWID